MGIPKNDGRMEGWLYIIRSSRIGLQFSRKRYFVLDDNFLKCYKAIPVSQNEAPLRGSKIDCCIHVTDEGRESINRKVFFIFTLFSTLNHNDKLKFGASSPEDAAKWISSLKNAVLKECSIPVKDFMTLSKNKWPPLRLNNPRRSSRKGSIDFSSSLHSEAASDVVAPSPWKIFGCQNGLRLFKESKDLVSWGRHWEEDPAIMAVGVVDGTSEAIYRTLMSLGPSRAEWDFCFYRGSVVEHLDGHTDIIHKQLYSEWLPSGMKRRDLLMRRYWRREEDGTYVILYHSVLHKKRPPGKGYIRACLKSGGYVVTPVNQGRQSLVKHMLAVDWKCWKSFLRPSSARAITIRMLGRVAALRELFRANSENDSSSDLSSKDLPIDFISANIAKEDGNSLKKIDENSSSMENEAEKSNSAPSNLMDLNDTSDEFFDVPDSSEPLDFESMDAGWSTDMSEELLPSNSQPRLSSAVNFVKKLQELTAAQKKGYGDLQDMTKEDVRSYCFGETLQKDTSCTLPCSWSSADPSTFLIRGENYLKDHRKIKAKGTLLQMVGADWLKSDERVDDICSRSNSIVQKYAEQGRPEFFFVVNIQVPGSTSYSLALYYMLKAPMEDTPLLHNFVNGDDAFRNARFKLIPYISKGSWIVKQSVGKKAGMVGQALDVRYYRGKNYLESCIDVGSSTVARGVVNLVLGYLNNLVIEMAFLIQGNTEEELPEFLLGTCRLSHLDASKSVVV